ncbi:MAG: acyltransferase [Gammaproteobacteria bacterium]|nr:acyltransferase [Gammaproteobacteria bacterium]
MSFYDEMEMREMGFGFVGKNVKISRKSSYYNPARIYIDDHSRIDDFCVLSAGEGGIYIGKYVHLAVYCLLVGKGCIKMEDYSGLSSRVSIYSSNDDYSGNYMTNPTVDAEFTNVCAGDVIIGKHVIVGSGSVILPNVHIAQGCAIGSLSLVNKNCEDFGIYMGVPLKRLKSRSRKLLDLEEKLKSK